MSYPLRIFVSSQEKRTSRVLLYKNTRQNAWTHWSLLPWWGWFQFLLLIHLFCYYLLRICYFYFILFYFNCLHRNMSRSIYIAYGMYSQWRFLCTSILRILVHSIWTDCRVRGNIWNSKSVPYKLGDVQKARSVRRFAAQLNLTNNPDRSSLVQI